MRRNVKGASRLRELIGRTTERAGVAVRAGQGCHGRGVTSSRVVILEGTSGVSKSRVARADYIAEKFSGQTIEGPQQGGRHLVGP